MSEATTKLAAALVKAQAEMPAVEPDSTNPHYRSKFVSLGHLLAKVRPVLNRHGVGVVQYPSRDENGPTLVTILLHESGERLESEAPLLLPKQDPQGQGSAITYMRRYALAAALGISDQEDDDGNGASEDKATKGKPKPAKPATNGKPHISAADAKKLRESVKASGVPVDQVALKLTAIGVSKLDELTTEQADELFAWMQDVGSEA